MTSLLTRVSAALLLLTLLASCTARQTYSGLQTGERNRCAKQPPSQYDECMAHQHMSYDEYEALREETGEN